MASNIRISDKDSQAIEAYLDADLIGRSMFILPRESKGRRMLASKISIPKIAPESSMSINIPSCNLMVLFTLPCRNWIYRASACSSKLIFTSHLLQPIGSDDNRFFAFLAINYFKCIAREFLSSHKAPLKARYNLIWLENSLFNLTWHDLSLFYPRTNMFSINERHMKRYHGLSSNINDNAKFDVEARQF